jgi:repressor LexA
MARKSMGLGDRHKKILEFLDEYQLDFGYPPSIREIGDRTGISSTSVVNYYLDQLVTMGYIKRENHISRGIRLLKLFPGAKQSASRVSQTVQNVAQSITEMLRIPVVGRIIAGLPMPVPGSDFSYFDSETAIDIARSLLPSREKVDNLFALEVQGDSMIDAMVNDGDIVIMKRTEQARNGEMVGVWLTDKEETTLKYFYLENGRVRLQPANRTMQPIYIEDPSTVEIQGKVVLVIRRLESLVA